MSNTSSDAESSCGWSIISMEGSDFETLAADSAGPHGPDEQKRPAVAEPELQDSPDSASVAGCHNDKIDGSLDDTLGDKTVDENSLCASEDTSPGNLSATWSPLPVPTEPRRRQGGADDADAAEHVAVLSSSEHSDIVTLKELKEDECDGTEETAAADEGLFLGTSSSSRYTFTAAEPAAQLPPAATNSSSSEEEAALSVVVRRRRLRRNTANTVTESCEEETTMESEEEEQQEEEEDKQLAEQTGDKPATVRMRRQGSATLNSCVLLAVVIALSVAFGHFYGTVHVQERQKNINKVRENELNSVRDVLQNHVKSDNLILDELDEQKLTSLFIEVVKKMDEENKELSIQQGRGQKKLRNLHSKIQDLEARAAAADALLSETKSLKDKLEDEKNLLSENQKLKDELDREKELRKQLDKERNLAYEAEAQESRARLRKLEERLAYEEQRSNMWERLYLETKEDRAKGDTEPKVAKAKGRTSGVVKDTFDAVKNSTKEFVHHHKEQIKKAKEVVKENLRKFSDSVKSTFRHFKDSASTFINTMKREGIKFYEEENYKEKKGQPRQDANTRKSGNRVHKERGQSTNPKGCRGVFDCAYHESMTVFNKAAEPIRADEFHQLLWSYLQREVHNFRHWKELESFIKGFFRNGLFIHDHMLFTDFVSRLEQYLVSMPEYHGLHDHAFGDVDDFIYRHLFGEPYAESAGPSGPLERPDSSSREELRMKHQGRRQQRQKAWRRSRRRNGHRADVKLRAAPTPFEPKY
ncbi:LOW QUALITY PROTEIN: cell cycle progression protein 1 [Syngnathoides biaculeatus]|uniref:LOW QUALITY PROTEIN: cell cycle progression protein 1 n=1 Tax=Syngnathoides biaculeatus TaxID=300417 RepID=UPI002ADE1CF6|nr:LOW QUALITY PROTEIN: cell cycle progression protein 1 [Syngnathoides biaculeatus]